MYFLKTVLISAELSLQPDMTALGVQGVTACFQETEFCGCWIKVLNTCDFFKL